MSFLSSLKRGLAAAAMLLGVATAAQAATIAQASYGGSYDVTNNYVADKFSLSLNGVFQGSFDDVAVAALTPSSNLEVNVSLAVTGYFDFMTGTETIQTTAGELSAFATSALSDPIVGPIISYILGNTGAPFALAGGTLTSNATVFVSTPTMIVGSLLLNYVNTTSELPLLPELQAEGGAFSLSLEISEISAVPLPASMPLLLLGVAGIAAARRRKA